MALPINIEDLLNKRKVEGNRIEFFEQSDKVERKKGWIQGIPTIQEKLAANGSPRATFETTEDRLTFLIHIPVHAGSEKSSEEKAISSKTTTETTTEKIVRLIRKNPHITNKELAAACGITEDGVNWNIKKLRKNNIIRRVGGDFGGHWEVLKARNITLNARPTATILLCHSDGQWVSRLFLTRTSSIITFSHHAGGSTVILM